MALDDVQKATLANSLGDWIKNSAKGPINGRALFVLNLLDDQAKESLYDKIIDDEEKAISVQLQAWNKRKEDLPKRHRLNNASPKNKGK